MRTITRNTYVGLENKGRTCIVGTVPHLINNGQFTPVRVNPECGQQIKVEAYGGGTRWYCPVCDTYHNGHRTVISYTNGNPPKDLTCHR